MIFSGMWHLFLWCRVCMFTYLTRFLHRVYRVILLEYIELNLYWNVDSSIAERKAREALILDLMELAKELDLSFYDGRIRQQR